MLNLKSTYNTSCFLYFFKVHRLVVIDDDDKVIGIISLSDLLFYLVLRPCGKSTIFQRSSLTRSQSLMKVHVWHYVKFLFVLIFFKS